MDNQENSLAPLILTLKIDRESLAFFDALRRKHFPPERNFLAAHVTLFHHLPGSRAEEIKADLDELCRQSKTFDLRFPALRFLGKGVAVEIESAELNRFRETLKNKWLDVLNNQDRQKFKLHITIQNKVAPEVARRLFEELSENWTNKDGTGIGIEIWHYLNGPWRLAGEFAFSA